MERVVSSDEGEKSDAEEDEKMWLIEEDEVNLTDSQKKRYFM